MVLDQLGRVALFLLLNRVERDLAEAHRAEGCPHCGGRLHLACYERNPRGGPDDLPDELLKRLSFCCDQEGCRRRSLPPSVLFWGRRVYWGAVVMLVVTLRQRRDASASLRKLRKRLGVSLSTVRRWMRWFAEAFALTPEWQRVRGQVRATVDSGDLPSGLVRLFEQTSDSADDALVRCLRLLASDWRGGKMIENLQ